MTNQSTEILQRYQENNGLFFPIDTVQKAFAYSDGDKSEQYLLNAMLEAKDTSIGSPELKKFIRDWPSHYHLSDFRSNIMRPFKPLLEGKRVLEVGAGCGAISRYLTEIGADLYSVEGSLQRAKIIQARTRDLPNIHIVVDNIASLDLLGTFDVVVVIGVLEYSRVYAGGEIPFLEKLKSYCDPENGCMLLAIENQLGLKYFSGAPEDHLGQPYYGIEERYSVDTPKTFGKRALSKLLGENGFPYQHWYYPFPDYKMPSTIFGQEALNGSLPTFDASSMLALACMSQDGQSENYQFSLEGSFQVLNENLLVEDFSNSFMVLSSNSQSAINASSSQAFAWHYSSDRHKIFQKETRFSLLDDGNIFLERKTINEQKSQTNRDNKNPILFHPGNEKYIQGKNYWLTLVDIVNKKNWTAQQVSSWAKPWHDKILVELGATKLDFDSNIDGKYFDAIPLNLNLDTKNQFSFHALEWTLDEKLSFGQLLVHGLYTSFCRLSGAAEPNKNTPIGIIKLIEHVIELLGYSINEPIVTNCIKQELRLDAWIKDSLDIYKPEGLIDSATSKAINKAIYIRNKEIPQRWTKRIKKKIRRIFGKSRKNP
jgi:2-polyprenyl-3-methyl-5-hydroxy-6-metoxy-1,4-benzoquinol methylase